MLVPKSTLQSTSSCQLPAGAQVLAQGGPALDAVEVAVRILEDDPSFDAVSSAVLPQSLCTCAAAELRAHQLCRGTGLRHCLAHVAQGTGSVLNAAGDVEMDAILMDGRTLATGAVAGVDTVRNPVSLARMVRAAAARFASASQQCRPLRLNIHSRPCRPLGLGSARC